MNLIRDFRLLRVLYSREHVSIPALTNTFNLPYQTVVSILNRWKEKDIVEKNEVENKTIGGIKYTYCLSSNGSALWEEIIELIRQDLPQDEKKPQSKGPTPHPNTNLEADRREMEQRFLDLANQLVMEIPEFLRDVGLEVTQDAYQRFVGKLKLFFSENGLVIE